MSERTKIWIADAMKRLLVKKPLQKIFVTEICREAEIERPTFYYHFQDKYDLMAWIFCQRTLQTDVLSMESAAAAMNSMRQINIRPMYSSASALPAPAKKQARRVFSLCGSFCNQKTPP